MTTRLMGPIEECQDTVARHEIMMQHEEVLQHPLSSLVKCWAFIARAFKRALEGYFGILMKH